MQHAFSHVSTEAKGHRGRLTTLTHWLSSLVGCSLDPCRLNWSLRDGSYLGSYSFILCLLHRHRDPVSGPECRFLCKLQHLIAVAWYQSRLSTFRFSALTSVWCLLFQSRLPLLINIIWLGLLAHRPGSSLTVLNALVCHAPPLTWMWSLQVATVFLLQWKFLT